MIKALRYDTRLFRKRPQAYKSGWALLIYGYLVKKPGCHAKCMELNYVTHSNDMYFHQKVKIDSIFMRTLFNNFLTLLLAFVLGFSPIQSIAASVSSCMDSTNSRSSMHLQMKGSDKSSQHVMGQTNQQHDCCDQNECQMSHCISVFTAIMPSFSVKDLSYTATDISLIPSASTIQFYPSSLYRPPKV